MKGFWPNLTLTTSQWSRYARHLSLEDVGVEGQEKLLAARVLVVGAGGLGSPALLYLAAAGVGAIGIVDSDKVESSNLQRQVIFGSEDLGEFKVDAAQNRLLSLNPDLKIRQHHDRLSSRNAMQILPNYDMIIDGSDNFPTRYLTNDAAVFLKIPNVFGCVQGFDGQASVFWPSGPAGGPCYRCLFPEPPPAGAVPSCSEAGVLGVLPGLIGMIQATEAIKLILGKGTSLAGRLLQYDAMAMNFRNIKIRRNPDCPVCGDNPTITRLIDYEAFCADKKPASNNPKSKNDKERFMEQITVEEIKKRLDAGEKLTIIDVRNPDEHAAGSLPGSILIPLPELPNRLAELDAHKNEEIIVHCQKGGRSARACGLLQSSGFSHPVNVTGGYEAWRDLKK